MFKIMFALTAALSFVISEAKARDCLEVINPGETLPIEICNQGGCYWSHSKNVEKVEDLEEMPKLEEVNGWPRELLKHVKQNYPGPTQYPPRPWQGWVQASRLGFSTACVVIGFRRH
jgi:hypothetical protein